jgi:small conductance mechanosensitive channel
MFSPLFNLMLLVQDANGAGSEGAAEADVGTETPTSLMDDPLGAAEKLKDWAIDFAPSLVGAVLTLVIGLWVAKLVKRGMLKGLGKSRTDAALAAFLSNIAYYILVVMVLLASLGKLGVQTTSFIAIIGAAGLAIGFALQGSLGNMAAGVMILLHRPFSLGDFVEVAGQAGVIEEIGIFATTIRTGDNKRVIVPNGGITDGPIVNYSANDTRRVDMVFGIGYSDDIDQAKAVIHRVLAEEDLILEDPAPTVGLMELADSSVNFVTRPWCKTADYWTVHFNIHEATKKAFDAEGISIPFPQRDIHVFNETNT